jgi:hypothetical protein
MPSTTNNDGQSTTPNLNAHPLVSQLHADPDTHQGNKKIVGYLGPSRVADYIRIYTDLSFAEYFEVKRADILSTVAVNPQDENSPTVVFVKEDATIEHTSIVGSGADYLKGAIVNDYFASASTAGNVTQQIMPSPVFTEFCSNVICQAQAQPNGNRCGSVGDSIIVCSWAQAQPYGNHCVNVGDSFLVCSAAQAQPTGNALHQTPNSMIVCPGTTNIKCPATPQNQQQVVDTYRLCKW